MTDTSSKTKRIDSVAMIAIALGQSETPADYHRLVAANEPADFDAAWRSLSSDQQQHIKRICGATLQPNLQAITSLLTTSNSVNQLQEIKERYGKQLTIKAWKLLPLEERVRLKALYNNQQSVTAVETQRVTEPSHPIKQLQPNSSNLFNISDDLEKLNELLCECGDDTQQQELIAQWLEQMGEERDKKLDAYAALIIEMLARAEMRKAEALRMMQLAAADENRAQLLKDKLKCFFESHNLKIVETARYQLTLSKKGGKQPLILKEGLSPTKLPECFQKVTVDYDTTAIRSALERGEALEWAVLGERGSNIRIK